MTRAVLFPRFITNSPSGEDLLGSRSQEKIANSIESHLQNDENEQKLIGLDGKWGSGKSNVIHIVKKNLIKTHHVFIYDAWSHQEDLQRRSFIEELTRDLSLNDIVDSSKWDEKLKGLLAKKKETITKTIPKISPAYYFIFLAIMLLPFAKQLSEMISSYHPVWRLVVSVCPLILLLICWAYAANKNNEYKQFGKLLEIYKEKDLEKTVSEVISEKEPSVYEFRNWMIELSEDLKKDVIIVFDNMDRLTAEKVQNLWSSIHTFFSERTYKRLWVIVPFDRDHLNDAFNTDPKSPGTASAFVNKTFSVIFNVSPVVLTDWWGFFKIKFDEAFGDSQKTEFASVKSLYDRYKTTITPRDIIAFLNELVSLKLVWKEEIGLRYMALFALNKNLLLADTVTTILNKDYLKRGSVLFRDDQEVMNNMAALVYNVPLEKASQVTLSREMITAIRETNLSRLKELNGHPEFPEILEKTFSDVDLDIEPATNSLSEIEKYISGDDKDIITEAWQSIVNKQLSTPIDDQVFSETFKTLVAKAGFRVKPLVTYILTQWSISRNFNGTYYFHALDGLGSFVKTSSTVDDFEKLIPRLNKSPEVFIEFVLAAEQKYKSLNLTCTNSSLEEYFLKNFNQDWNVFKVLPILKDEYKFPKLIQVVETTLISETLLENLIQILDVYKAISIEIPLLQKLTDAKIDLMLNSSVVDSEEYFELVAMRVSRFENYAGSSALSTATLTLTDEKLIKEISKRIFYYTNYGELLNKSISWVKPLLIQVTKAITIENNLGNEKLAIKTVLPLFYEIVKAVDVRDEQLFNKLNGWNDFLKRDLTIDNFPEIIPDLRILELAIKIKNNISSTILNCLKNYIESVDEQKWLASLDDENSYDFDLLHNALRLEIISEFPRKAIDAYKNILEKRASETVDITLINPEAWKIFYQAISHDQLSLTSKNIRDIFLGKSSITPKKYLFFEDLLRTNGSLEERSGDFVRTVLIPVSSDEQSLGTIIKEKEFYLSILALTEQEKYDFIKLIYKKTESNLLNNELHLFENKLNALIASNFTVVSAKYIATDDKIDVTETLKYMVAENKNLHFPIVRNLTLTDGKDPVLYELSVEFQMDSKPKRLVFKATDFLNLL